MLGARGRYVGNSAAMSKKTRAALGCCESAYTAGREGCNPAAGAVPCKRRLSHKHGLLSRCNQHCDDGISAEEQRHALLTRESKWEHEQETGGHDQKFEVSKRKQDGQRDLRQV